jgi:hypothetical protein
MAEVVDSQMFLEYEYVLGHGDNRVHHLKSETFKRGFPRRKIFLDWEQFGKHKLGHDHVTYGSAENNLSDLGLDELSTLSGWILAYRNAGMKLNNKKRRKLIGELDDLASVRRSGIVSRVEGNIRDKFSLQMLAQGLAENIHLDSSNKRYTSEQRKSHTKGISGWTEERMLEHRLEKVRETLEFAATEAPYSAVENPTGVQNYFNLWANLLMRLELVDVPQETMKVLSKR